MEMASHIGVLNAGFDQVISESLPEVIDVVGGDSIRLAEAMELMVEEGKRRERLQPLIDER